MGLDGIAHSAVTERHIWKTYQQRSERDRIVTKPSGVLVLLFLARKVGDGALIRRFAPVVPRWLGYLRLGKLPGRLVDGRHDKVVKYCVSLQRKPTVRA